MTMAGGDGPGAAVEVPATAPAPAGAARPSLTRRMARSLNPAQLLFGPIFQMEVRSSGRRRWWYIGRAAYVAALLAVAGLVFCGMWSSLADTNSSVRRLQELQQLAPALALTVIWFQFAVLTLAGPNLTAPAIAGERLAGTLSALLTTPMTSGQIVGGKLASRLVHVLILSLLAAPVLLAVRVFGGLDAWIVLHATAVSLATAALGAALGLMYSTWSRRATSAGVFGLLTLILAQSAVPALDGILYLWLEDAGYRFHQWTLAASSPATLALLSQAAVTGAPPPGVTFEVPTWLSADGFMTAPMWLANVVYTLALAAATAMFTGVALRRAMLRDAGRDAGAGGAGPARGRRRKSAEPHAPDAPPASAAEPEEVLGRERNVGDNPVLWREVRQPTFGSRRTFAIAATLTLGGLLFLYLRWGPDEEGVQGSIAVIGAIAVMLQSVFMTTGGFVGEREGRTLEVLLTTTLTPRQVVLGKLVGAMRAQWFIPAVVMGHLGLSTVLGAVHPLLILHMALIFAGPMLLFAATGVLLSLILKRSTPASVGNLVLGLLFWLAPWLVLALASLAMVASPDTFDAVADVLAAFNPVAMAVSAFEPATFHHHRPLHYDFPSSNDVTALSFTLILARVFAVYAALAAATVWGAIAGFQRFTGRVS